MVFARMCFCKARSHGVQFGLATAAGSGGACRRPCPCCGVGLTLPPTRNPPVESAPHRRSPCSCRSDTVAVQRMARDDSNPSRGQTRGWLGLGKVAKHGPAHTYLPCVPAVSTPCGTQSSSRSWPSQEGGRLHPPPAKTSCCRTSCPQLLQWHCPHVLVLLSCSRLTWA